MDIIVIFEKVMVNKQESHLSRAIVNFSFLSSMLAFDEG